MAFLAPDMGLAPQTMYTLKQPTPTAWGVGAPMTLDVFGLRIGGATLLGE